MDVVWVILAEFGVRSWLCSTISTGLGPDVCGLGGSAGGVDGADEVDVGLGLAETVVLVVVFGAVLVLDDDVGAGVVDVGVDGVVGVGVGVGVGGAGIVQFGGVPV
jgi:hypothetical protein